MSKLICKKDIVSGSLWDKAQKGIVYDNKDYFLKDIVTALGNTETGKKIAQKVNTVTDPIIENALDKAVIKFRSELIPLYVLLVLVVLSNVLILTKN